MRFFKSTLVSLAASNLRHHYGRLRGITDRCAGVKAPHIAALHVNMYMLYRF